MLNSFIHLMRAIAFAAGLMHVNNSTYLFELWHVLFRDENALAFNKIPAFSSVFVPLPIFQLYLNVDYFCDTLFTLKVLIFLYD